MWHLPEGNFTGNAQGIYQWYEFENLTYLKLQPHPSEASESIWYPYIEEHMFFPLSVIFIKNVVAVAAYSRLASQCQAKFQTMK